MPANTVITKPNVMPTTCAESVAAFPNTPEPLRLRLVVALGLVTGFATGGLVTGLTGPPGGLVTGLTGPPGGLVTGATGGLVTGATGFAFVVGGAAVGATAFSLVLPPPQAQQVSRAEGLPASTNFL